MKKRTSNVGRRILAMALAVFMVCTSIPLPMVTYATEQDEVVKNNKALTIYVKGKESEESEDLVALSEAIVQYTIAANETDAKSEEAEWITLAETDTAGTFILPADSVSTMTGQNVYIKVVRNGYDEVLEVIACDSLITEEQEKTIEMSLSVTVEEIKDNVAVSVKVTDTAMQSISENLQVQYIIADSETLPEEASDWISATEEINSDGTLLLLEENSIDKSIGYLWVKVSCNGYIPQSFSVNLSEYTEAYTQEIILKKSVNTTVSISDADKATVVINNETVVFNQSNTGMVTVPETIDGETISYKIIANDGYYVKKVTIGEDSEDLSIEEGKEYTNTFSASDAVDIQIELGQYYTVSVSEETIGATNEEDGGTVTLNTSDVTSVTVDTENSVAIKVTPNEGFIISSVVIGNEEKITGNADETTFEGTVNGTENIKVQFTKIYTVIMEYDNEKGDVTDFNTTQEVVAGSVTSVVYGSKFKFTATPKDGYRVISVKIDDTEVPGIDTANNSTYTGEVSTEDKTNHTVEITFALNVYDITTNIPDKGSVVLSTATGNVEHFGEVTVTVTPDSGYTLKKDGIIVNDILVNVNEITRNTDGTYTFKISDIKENKKISVEFCKISAGKDTDYTIDDANALRSVNGNYFVLKENDVIIFTTEQEKIRVYKEGEDSPVEDTESFKKVGISGNAAIVAIDAYYCAENEMFAEWHTITLANPISLIVDSTPVEVSDDVKITPEKNEYGYYNENVTVSISVTDNGDYSGIASIEYFITHTADVFDKEDTVTEYDSISDVNRTNLYTFETGNEIKQSISLEDIQKCIVVNTEENNSPYTKVWIKVTDRAGNAVVKTIALPINATSPEMELAFTDTKETGVTGKYYTGRELQITVKDRGDTFLAENVLNALNAAIKKNGTAIDITESDITWDCVKDDTGNCKENVHIGTYSFKEDGTYSINVDGLKYQNKAGMQNAAVTIKEGTENVTSFVIDNEAPASITVEHKPESDTDNDKFYKDYIDVIITAEDTNEFASGIKTIEWKYVKLEEASNINEASDAEWTTIEVDENNITYNAEIRIPRNYDDSSENKKQFHGYLMIQVTDWAGHVSTVLEDNEQIFIIDNKAPEQNVFYAEPKETVDNQAYYDGEFEVIFFINEANFDATDVKAYVSKDSDEKVQIPLEDIKWDNKEWTDIEWDTVEADVHVGRYTVNGNSVVVDSSENVSNDGDYKFYLEYTDKSGNKMVYESHVLTIDETEPVVDFSYDEKSQEMTFTVTEYNFRPNDISVSGTIKNIRGEDSKEFSVTELQTMLQTAKWTKVEDAIDTYVYTYKTTEDGKMDGLYNLEINYTDISQRKAAAYKPEQFVVDHIAPTEVQISYGEKTLLESLMDKIFEAVTLGFYKPDVTVTFTAHDYATGIESFSWKYTKQDGASTINRDTDTEYTVVTDSIVQNEDDKSMFTATITLPDVDKQQLRGYLTVYATDAYKNGNEEDAVSDEDNVIIIDTKNPELTEEHYSKEDGLEGTVRYYQDSVEVRYTINEANFYAEKVKVDVTKDGIAYTVTPEWKDVDVDTHTATFTLSEDGDYVITVSYMDYSENSMETYTSDKITIDKIDPIVDFSYDKKSQEMTFTVTEHNFRPEHISLLSEDTSTLNKSTIQDVNGNNVSFTVADLEKLLQKAKWTEVAVDTYTYTCTTDEKMDGIYNLNINYTDISQRKAATYKPEQFIVDHKAPENITITYSQSLFSSVLEALTFGYYKTDVKVTFTAYDTEAGVDYFTWNYTKEKDASDVNLRDTEDVMVKAEQENPGDKSKYTATITLPDTEIKQLRGYLTVSATDKMLKANESDIFSDDGHIIVVDSISPIKEGEIGYSDENNKIETTRYYQDTAKVTFMINEANFYPEDVSVMVTKDNKDIYAVTPEWTNESVDRHIGSVTLNGDGDYVITVNYKDRSTNEMVAFTSDVITIDTIDPELGFAFDREKQKMIFTVTEHNFRPQDISLNENGTITDINGKAIEGLSIAELESILQTAEWTEKENDVYTYETTSCPDGIYNFETNYMDLALREAKTCKTNEFIIDHTVPSNVEITYSKSLWETILETITFGFYKADAKVTFTAYDQTSGVDYFTWNYTKENGASDINRATDTETTQADAVQDKNDKSKFIATITLPDTDVKQLRGYLAAVATDNYANVGPKVTDSGRIIVVDSIAPTMEAEYSAADRVVGNTSYYNDIAEVTFTVTEANFYAEDVEVMVSKDGGTAYAVTPKWTDKNVDTHVGTFTLSGDGDYVVTVNYTDRSTNQMTPYVSHTITIDTIQPVIDVVYENTNVINTLTDRDGMNRKYFADTQTAVITITEHNFNAEDVVFDMKATDVTGTELDVNSLHVKSEWKAGEKPDTHVLTITYPGDANYTFDMAYSDLATNASADYAADYFTVDNTTPINLNVAYSTSILETILEAITFGFYDAKVDVTLTADDEVSGVHEFMYSYTIADGVSAVNAELINQAITASDITYSNAGKTATVHFEIPKDVLTDANQFNGTISFEVTDRAGLKNTLVDNKRIIVDNIAPTAQVTYSEPVNTEGTISYYDGNVNATVVITEANFYAEDVSVMVSKDGGASYEVIPTWDNNSVDIHTGTFTLTEDGDYFITINYRDKSSNEMVVYTSEQLTIDTDIQEPSITFNGNNEDRMAYKGEIIPEISFSDVNYDSFEVFLYRTYMDAISVDITEEKGIQNLFSISEETGNASLNVFGLGEDGKYNPNDDGIYRLLITMQDKAGHSIEKEAYFTINRYGSVYAYNEYLVNLIADGGAFVNAVMEDLVITEYNADRLVTDSLNIEITRDGKPLEDVKYTVSPVMDENASVGASGWYQYEYVISKENFILDGIYKISISSTDATGNKPENSNFADKNILFYVDSTVPEITSIVGLEKAIVDATELEIAYTVFDAIGLKSIKIYVDNEILQDITDFTDDFNNYSGSFVLEEREDERAIRIVVEDMAGNITDTAAEDFTSAYVFNDVVRVTTNALVRFYADKPLFYGTIGGTAGIAGLIGFGIRRSKLKKKTK